ncbi:uncharacterized protein N7503_009370 [Penicillium pulvis]|uniref:uncharacterized protein n=1 Tax=Penicillium pulvis TaxID=1562058 RepID=UPI002546E771|nr:uncharacterized protein N7503_009370 [Penicillium pulvis]KAJ5793392.1 hypothetical protein N7503_009370 [Penicillium pulvis]
MHRLVWNGKVDCRWTGQYHEGQSVWSWELMAFDPYPLIEQMIIRGSMLYITSLWLIKAGMVTLYKRLGDRTRYENVYNITLGILAATWLVLISSNNLICYPVRRRWEQISNPELICLPITQIARTKMPNKQKCLVISIFLLGILVVIVSSTSPLSRPTSSPLNHMPVVQAIYSYRKD